MSAGVNTSFASSLSAQKLCGTVAISKVGTIPVNKFCLFTIDKTERIACLFNIVAINGVILRISLISIDGRYVIYQDLPISLPSLGLVDNDLAREFASNCADLVYIEKSSSIKNSVAILKMRI
jgi:hypothetical protein